MAKFQALSVYKTKPFARFAVKANISDEALWQSAQTANEGHVDANLGGGVFKQRVARKGAGKSGGSRCILVLKRNDLAVFVFGFEKKNMANIPQDDLKLLKLFSREILNYDRRRIERALQEGSLIQINERGT